MAVPESGLGGELEVKSHWRALVEGWMARAGHRPAKDADSVSMEFGLPEADRAVTVRFMTTTRLLVAFMTDGRFLRPDQLALAAAAANAWNTEQLVPMLSVWDVRGPNPCLAGTCSLPLQCRVTRSGFDELANDWSKRSGQMFLRCHQVFKL